MRLGAHPLHPEAVGARSQASLRQNKGRITHCGDAPLFFGARRRGAGAGWWFSRRGRVEGVGN
ncbi:MAG: hypothetical protein CBC48_12510 [bacterium TMED88]|nr:MAG: hypothetical protein CBC48_12510 [bacterium TMED88]